jgi:hypothetical protein
MTMRIGLGFLIQIVALISAAIIEMVRYRVVRNVGLVDAFNAAGPDADPLDPKFIEPMRCANTYGSTSSPRLFLHWRDAAFIL